jgi:hypothetical protein
MSLTSSRNSGCNLTLSLDATLAQILMALVSVPESQADKYLEKAWWMYHNVPLENLREAL